MVAFIATILFVFLFFTPFLFGDWDYLTNSPAKSLKNMILLGLGIPISILGIGFGSMWTQSENETNYGIHSWSWFVKLPSNIIEMDGDYYKIVVYPNTPLGYVCLESTTNGHTRMVEREKVEDILGIFETKKLMGEY